MKILFLSIESNQLYERIFINCKNVLEWNYNCNSYRWFFHLTFYFFHLIEFYLCTKKYIVEIFIPLNKNNATQTDKELRMLRQIELIKRGIATLLSIIHPIKITYVSFILPTLPGKKTNHKIMPSFMCTAM